MSATDTGTAAPAALAALPPGRSSSRLQRAQAQVQEVAEVVHVNVVKLLDRDHKLSELDDKAQRFEDESKLFKVTTERVRRKYWWKNFKLKLVLAAVAVLVVVVLLVWLLV